MRATAPSAASAIHAIEAVRPWRSPAIVDKVMLGVRDACVDRYLLDTAKGGSSKRE